jgi:hypothetical protein
MRRRVIPTAFLAASLVAGSLVPAFASDGAAAPGASRLAWVKVTSCSRADNSAVFYARMQTVGGAERMAMRFSLLERAEDGSYEPVEAPGLGRWRRSKPDVGAFGYRQRVRNLTEGSIYRARVQFRWYDAEGDVLRRARRVSGPCSQAGPLPNLRVRLVGTAPTEFSDVSR